MAKSDHQPLKYGTYQVAPVMRAVTFDDDDFWTWTQNPDRMKVQDMSTKEFDAFADRLGRFHKARRNRSRFAWG